MAWEGEGVAFDGDTEPEDVLRLFELVLTLKHDG